MSEAQKTNPVVVRNDASFEFTWTATGKKHSMPGLAYPMPLLKPGQLQNDENARAWYGDIPEQLVNRALRAVYADIAIDALNKETGELDMQVWLLAAAEPNAGRAKIADLEAEVDTHIDIVAAMTDKACALMEAEGNEEANAAEAAKINSEAQHIIRTMIKPLRKKIAEIKDKYDKIVAAREAKAAAKPVAAAAA